MHPHELAVEVAARVHDAVAPHLGAFEARVKVGDAPGGDATLAIDEIAETVVREQPRGRGRHRVLLRGPGPGPLRRRRARSSSSTRSTAPGPRPPASSPAASRSRSCRPSEQATLGEVSFGVVHELKTGQRFRAERGAGTQAEEADGTPVPDRALRRTPISTRCSGPPGSAAGRRCR